MLQIIIVQYIVIRIIWIQNIYETVNSDYLDHIEIEIINL